MADHGIEHRVYDRSNDLIIPAPLLSMQDIEGVDTLYLGVYALERAIIRDIEGSATSPLLTSRTDLIREVESQAAKMGAENPASISERVVDRLLNKSGRFKDFRFTQYAPGVGMQTKSFSLLKMRRDGLGRLTISPTDETRQMILRMLTLDDNMRSMDLVIEAMRLALQDGDVGKAALMANYLKRMTEDRMRSMREKLSLCKTSRKPDWDSFISEVGKSIDHLTSTRKTVELLIEEESGKAGDEGFGEFLVVVTDAVASLSRLRQLLWDIHFEGEQAMIGRFSLEPSPLVPPDEMLQQFFSSTNNEIADLALERMAGAKVVRQLNLSHFIAASLLEIPDRASTVKGGERLIGDGVKQEEARQLSGKLVDQLLVQGMLNIETLGCMKDGKLNDLLKTDLDRLEANSVLHQAIAKVFIMFTDSAGGFESDTLKPIETPRYEGMNIQVCKEVRHAAA